MFGLCGVFQAVGQDSANKKLVSDSCLHTIHHPHLDKRCGKKGQALRPLRVNGYNPRRGSERGASGERRSRGASDAEARSSPRRGSERGRGARDGREAVREARQRDGSRAESKSRRIVSRAAASAGMAQPRATPRTRKGALGVEEAATLRQPQRGSDDLAATSGGRCEKHLNPPLLSQTFMRKRPPCVTLAERLRLARTANPPQAPSSR